MATDPTSCTPSSVRPYLFLDVDGVLSPFASDSDAWDDFTDTPGAGFELPLSRSMAAALAGLDLESVWLTTWEHEANKVVAPALGWDPLEVIESGTLKSSRRRWWKLAALDWWMAGHASRPFVWIDDDIRSELAPDPDRRLARYRWATSSSPFLLICPDRDVGITRAHIEEIKAFIVALTR